MIAALLESGVDFVAADMPLANQFTIHILAAVAEYEANLISERTRAAFAAANGFNSQDPAISDNSAASGKRSTPKAHEATLSGSQIQSFHLNQISGSKAEITMSAKLH
jgi:Resolvase, N terminal domain